MGSSIGALFTEPICKPNRFLAQHFKSALSVADGNNLELFLVPKDQTTHELLCEMVYILLNSKHMRDRANCPGFDVIILLLLI